MLTKTISITAIIFCSLFATAELLFAQTNLMDIGHVNDFEYGAFDVAVKGHYAYLANGGDGLRIYDVSNPTNLKRIGHTNDVGRAGSAMGIALFGDYAYVANSNDGMRIYDISDPANPINIGHAAETNQPASSFGIAVSGIQRKGFFEFIKSWLPGRRKVGAQYAYLANYNDGLLIYDVSNPAKPNLIGHVNDGGTALYPTVSGNYVFLANDYDGLRIYDVSNPASPTNIARIKDGGYPWGVVIAGKFAYIADNFDGFQIDDISDPKHPVSIGHINNNPPREAFNGHNNDHPHDPKNDGSAYGIAVVGNRAYLANFGDGLRIYDISNPTNLINIAHSVTNYGGFARRIAVSGDYAYVANSNDGLRIYKIGNHHSHLYFYIICAITIFIIGFILARISKLFWRTKTNSKKPLND
jgi:hypothetical protein